eukprot:6493133-Prymnesium_polylepis.1
MQSHAGAHAVPPHGKAHGGVAAAPREGGGVARPLDRDGNGVTSAAELMAQCPNECPHECPAELMAQ